MFQQCVLLHEPSVQPLKLPALSLGKSEFPHVLFVLKLPFGAAFLRGFVVLTTALHVTVVERFVRVGVVLCGVQVFGGVRVVF